ncbi:MAG TPA: hypothetical protein VMS08_06105 [Candidatus Saccharimonadia bacterium]|nr:hypothetical protein [Candidatus Saccharimonadia bacterium]
MALQDDYAWELTRDHDFTLQQRHAAAKVVRERLLGKGINTRNLQARQILSPIKRPANNECRLYLIDGDISNYYPDFVVKTADKEIWVVETKGREDLDDRRKVERLAQWCGALRICLKSLKPA